jgi:PadR family transcriptional regulator PadR
VLRGLEGGGLLDSHVEPSVSGPPRRYYRITPAGRDVLARWSGAWRATRDSVDAVLGPLAAPASTSAAPTASGGTPQ